ncbi:hypothetical protein SH501x_000391 [Pirellulaceae bacterium SH501]
MITITIDEIRGGVLIPLRDVVARLPINQVLRIRLRDFQMHYGQPLGMTLQDFESRTSSKEGIVLTSEEFNMFAALDMQIIDGQIELEIQCGEKSEKLLVECVDATLWELSSESDEVMRLIANE